MELDVFSKLCGCVCEQIGVKKFRPEACLRAKKKPEEDLKGFSGEIKMAMSIRMMAGGSHLDLVPLFGMGSSHLCTTFEAFLDWITSTFQFPLTELLRQRNWTALERLANAFAEKMNGIFFGPFCALDGLAVRVRCPTIDEDIVDPGNCCCRKGFYALNVQAICDKWKRFLWSCLSNEGSTHDSAAFGGSRLVDLSNELGEELCERGLFIAGDSACALTPHMIVPHEVTEMKQDPLNAKDSLNFHLSSCCIYMECAFGESVMRWGIFWRTLLFDVKKCTKVINTAMLLQNFIIENRQDGGACDGAHFENFKVDHNDLLQQRVTKETGEIPRALVTDNDEPRPPGR